MIRKILGLMTAICLLLGCAASAEGGPEAVTSAELVALLASVREQALASEVLNDPADEAARSEDGIRFQYTMADFYADGDALTAETPVNVLLFQDSEGEVFRGTGIDTHWIDLLSAYPLDNPDLEGTKEQVLADATTKVMGRTADVHIEGVFFIEDNKICLRLTNVKVKKVFFGRDLTANLFDHIDLYDFNRLNMPVELDEAVHEDGFVLLKASRHPGKTYGDGRKRAKGDKA